MRNTCKHDEESLFLKFHSLHRDSNTFLSHSEGHQPISLGSGDKVWKTKRSSQPAEEPCSPGVELSALRSVSLLIPRPAAALRSLGKYWPGLGSFSRVFLQSKLFPLITPATCLSPESSLL